MDYDKIENHLKISKCMYELDQKGKHIISEFYNKKSKGKRRTGTYIFEDILKNIYKNIIYCLSLKRLKLYFHLQYFLDELLYYEVRNQSQFYIEDNIYDISKIYFAQEEWINDNFIQKFEFYNTTDVNINEAMYLVCYLKEYDLFLHDIEKYIKAFKDIKSIKSKLRYTIHKIRNRHNYIWNVLIEIINKKISLD